MSDAQSINQQGMEGDPPGQQFTGEQATAVQQLLRLQSDIEGQGHRVAMALNAWSLRMRNAGTPRRLASAKRQARRASSLRESEPTSDRWS